MDFLEWKMSYHWSLIDLAKREFSSSLYILYSPCEVVYIQRGDVIAMSASWIVRILQHRQTSMCRLYLLIRMNNRKIAYFSILCYFIVRRVGADPEFNEVDIPMEFPCV